MSQKPKQTKVYKFRQLLPRIYRKIIIDGCRQEDCAGWLRENKLLDISNGSFTVYLHRYGDIESERAKYQAYIDSTSTAWYLQNID